MKGFASYEGVSPFLRWWPKILLVAALAVLLLGWTAAIQWATFFTFAAWAQGHFIPWKFSIYDEGLLLEFAFGRRLFLPKSTTTVRLESMGAVAIIEGHRRLGYLLHDGVLYVPDQRSRLRRALNHYGYRIV